MKLYKNIIKIISNFIYMPVNTNDNKSILVFVLIGVVLLYIVLNMNKPCTAPVPVPTESFKNQENFEPNQESADLAQNTVQAVNFVDTNNLTVDVPTNEDYVEEQKLQQAIQAGLIDDSGVMNVEGTDLLLAAAADRFYSIDTKGQSNKNASYDIRGEEPIPYNENYTPFSASTFVGTPKISTGRL